jgi:hypothetical protein
MATVFEYFVMHSSNCVRRDMEVPDQEDRKPIVAQQNHEFEANAKYWCYFLPGGYDLISILTWVFDLAVTQECHLFAPGEFGSSFSLHDNEYPEVLSTDTAVFTRRIWLYIDETVDNNLRARLIELGNEFDFDVKVRDQRYAEVMSVRDTPLAFISHDSRDKDAFVRPLAEALVKRGCTVWYDEYSLRVGDSLRASIEGGLKHARRCIVVLSPNYLANNGWGKAEFDAAFTREIVEEKNVILPVWCGVGVKDVYAYSPRLADKVGLNSSLGIDEIADRLAAQLKSLT